VKQTIESRSSLPKVDKQLSPDELLIFAEWIDTKDQEPRSQIGKWYRKGYTLTPEFFNTDPLNLTEEGRKEGRKAQTELKQALDIMVKNDSENRGIIREFLQNNPFPNIIDTDLKVANTCWEVLQHADDEPELQVRGLIKMLEARRSTISKIPGITLVYFYYLTDRITMNLYGYQYFGTQSNGKNLVSIPKDKLEEFMSDPAKYCLYLATIQNKNPEPASQIAYLWVQALVDSKKVYSEELEYQDSIIPDMVSAYQ